MRVDAKRGRGCWKRLLLGGTVALVLALAPSTHADEFPTGSEAARQVVQETVDRVIEVLNQRDWSKEQRIEAIREIAYANFDFETMSRLVLARNYKKFDEAQRVEFVKAFKSYLSRSYSTRIDRYEQQRVDITGARVEKRGDVTVMTEIVGGDTDGFEIHYRMRDKGRGWKVIDVIIEGVSLVSNYRSQFKEVVNQGGPDELLSRLQDKNASFEEPSSSS